MAPRSGPSPMTRSSTGRPRRRTSPTAASATRCPFFSTIRPHISTRAGSFAAGPLELPLQPPDERAAVGDAGEVVVISQALETVNITAQPSGGSAGAAAHEYDAQRRQQRDH